MRMRNTLATLCAMVLGPVLALSGSITAAPTAASYGGTWMVAQQQQKSNPADTMRQKDQQQKQQKQGQQQKQQSGKNGQQQGAANIQVEPVLTTNLQDKMPADSLQDKAQVQADSVIMWTRINGVEMGDSVMVKHVWRHNGEEVFTVELPVKGPSWRTWSYNTIDPEEAGEWEVAVIGPNNEELATMQFTAQPGAGAGAQARVDGQDGMDGQRRNGQNGHASRPQNGQAGQQPRDTMSRDTMSRDTSSRPDISQPMPRDTMQRDTSIQPGTSQPPMGQNGQMGQQGQALQRWSSFAQQCLGQDYANADSTISGTILSMTPSSSGRSGSPGMNGGSGMNGMNGHDDQSGQSGQGGQTGQSGQSGQTGQSGQSSGRMQSGMSADELRFTVTTENNEQVMVYAGPKSQAAQQLRLSQGDEVTLRGTHCDMDGQRVFVPTSIESNGQTFELSQKNGSPKWEAKNGSQRDGMNGQGQQPRQQPDTGRSGSSDTPLDD